jgi:fatty-acyl-CoA synthase
MKNWHPLDRVIGSERPDLSTAEKLREFESVPYDERIAAQSTYDVLRIGASLDPDKTALHFLPNADPAEEGTALSYRDFLQDVTRSANMFHELGVRANDVVSFLLPLLPESFVTLFGAQAAGIANPVNPLLEPAQIAEILQAAGTKVLVTASPQLSAEIWAKVERVRKELPQLQAVVTIGPGTPDLAGVFAYGDLAKVQPGDALCSGRQIGADDTAAYFHTGGTTGMPKLVRHTHRNQVYQAWVIGLMLPTDTILFGLPLFHVGGALTQGLGELGSGATLVVLSPGGWRNPSAMRHVWRTVERFKPRVFGGVPTVLAAALNVPLEDADTSSIRYSSGGGSAIPVAVAERYRRQFNAPVLEVYGMTETASIHSMGWPDRPVRIGSVGHPCPYSSVRVVQLDAEGKLVRECPLGEIGVVAMAGPGVFSGYMSDKHNRHAFVEPGWVNSGDLGRLDDDGYLWITGRAKDIIIRGGHNIDPAPIEEILFQHPAVAFAAVVGEPDAYAGELPVAYVQAKPGMEVEDTELAAFVAQRTPERAANPVHIYIVDAIPLTGVGKVFKPALRWDAAQRKVAVLLQDLPVPISVSVGAHEVHGTLITVRAIAARNEAVEREVHARLDPLETRHELLWD